jgi:hypothetical protein
MALRFRSERGLESPIRFAKTCLDTASPCFLLPGECPIPCSNIDVLPDLVPVEVATAAPGVTVSLKLTPRDRLFKFGGIGGKKLNRYVFHASAIMEGIRFTDLVPVVFFDPSELKFPIASVAVIAEQRKYSVEFSPLGYRMRPFEG